MLDSKEIPLDRPILIFGKIASGKTTLVNQIINDNHINEEECLNIPYTDKTLPKVDIGKNIKAVIIHHIDLIFLLKAVKQYKKENIILIITFQTNENCFIDLNNKYLFEKFTVVSCDFIENGIDSLWVRNILTMNKLLSFLEYKELVTNAYQQTKEDLNELLLAFNPKTEVIKTHQDKIQAMYENLIAMRNVALTPHSNNN